MKKSLIISPTVYEAIPLFQLFGKSELPKVGETIQSDDKQVTVLVSGVGCEKSTERVVEAVKNFSPDYVLLAGYCGACKKHMKNGDFIYESTSETLSNFAQSKGAKPQKIASVREIAGIERKMQLSQEGYHGVEMEADIFAEAIAKSYPSVEFINLRWVSDSLELDIPPSFFQSLIDMKTGEMNMSKKIIFKNIIKSPLIIFKLKKFGDEIIPAQKAYSKDIVDIAKSAGNI